MDTGVFSMSKEPSSGMRSTANGRCCSTRRTAGCVYTNQMSSDQISLFTSRLLITLILELALGALVFGLREKAQQNLIGGVNLATRLALNLVLHYGLFYLGPWAGFALYAGMEVLVFAVEASASAAERPGRRAKRPARCSTP